jgi:hypothetical protein
MEKLEYGKYHVQTKIIKKQYVQLYRQKHASLLSRKRFKDSYYFPLFPRKECFIPYQKEGGGGGIREGGMKKEEEKKRRSRGSRLHFPMLGAPMNLCGLPMVG